MNFDDQFFAEIGLTGLTEEERQRLIIQMTRTILNRVAVRLEEVMTEDQLAGFDVAAEKGGDAPFEYLNRVYPDYPLLVQDETDRLKAELSHDVSDVMNRIRAAEQKHED